MPVNADLLRRIAAKIEREPESHNQTVWAKATECGTVGCIAGWALMLSGRRPPNKGQSHWLWWRVATGYQEEPCADYLLGLTRDEGKILFDPDWLPRPDLTVPAALRLLAEGASVAEVSR